MKIIKTHYDNYLDFFQVKKINSFFAISGLWLESETSQCGSYAILEKCGS